MNKISLKFTSILIIILNLGVVYRTEIFNCIVDYKSLSTRQNTYQPDRNFELFLEKKILQFNITEPEIEEVIELSHLITSSHLNFTMCNNDKDPNKLIESKSAHCVGYANFFKMTCHYLLKKFNLDENWKVSHQIGKIYFLGINVHQYFSSNFFLDHDFIILENKKSRSKIAVDPVLYDYLYIEKINLKKSMI